MFLFATASRSSLQLSRSLLLLLNQMGFLAEHVLKYLWPLVFIALGVWLIVRRFEDTKGGPQ